MNWRVVLSRFWVRKQNESSLNEWILDFNQTLQIHNLSYLSSFQKNLLRTRSKQTNCLSLVSKQKRNKCCPHVLRDEERHRCQLPASNRIKHLSLFGGRRGLPCKHQTAVWINRPRALWKIHSPFDISFVAALVGRRKTRGINVWWEERRAWLKAESWTENRLVMDSQRRRAGRKL